MSIKSWIGNRIGRLFKNSPPLSQPPPLIMEAATHRKAHKLVEIERPMGVIDAPIRPQPVRKRKAAMRWSRIDWSKRNTQIAKETGRHYVTVCLARQQYAPAHQQGKGSPHMQKYNWASVDWSRTDDQIAKDVGANLRAVRVARIRTEAKIPNTYCLHVPKDWESVDWTKQDCVISREMDASTSTVRYHRRRLGQPESPHKWTRTSGVPEKHRAEWEKWDWSKLDIRLSEEHNVTRERVRQIRNLLNKPKNPRGGPRFKYDWSKVDWNKPNSAIAVQVGCSNATVKKHRPADKLYRDLKRAQTIEKWRKLDWTKIDSVLSRETGITQGYLGRIRDMLGIPRSRGAAKGVKRHRVKPFVNQPAA